MFLDPCLHNNKAVDGQEGQTEYIVKYKFSDGIKNQVKFWDLIKPQLVVATRGLQGNVLNRSDKNISCKLKMYRGFISFLIL